LLQDISLLTFFVDPEINSLDRENGKNWQLRTYPSLNNLVPVTRPENAPSLKRGFECSWEKAADSEDLDQTKLGHIPTEIQSEPWWDYTHHTAKPEFCFQINTEEKVGLHWGDGGMVYLARGTAEGCSHRWFLDWQFY
jgi:hypothetical protein